MKDQPLEKKVEQDVAKKKKGLKTLKKDGATSFGRIVESTRQSTAALASQVDNGASQFSDEIEELAEAAKKNVKNGSTTTKKDFGKGLSQNNARAKEVTDKILGGFSKKAFGYSWVALALTLFVGVMLGTFLKPTR